MMCYCAWVLRVNISRWHYNRPKRWKPIVPKSFHGQLQAKLVHQVERCCELRMVHSLENVLYWRIQGDLCPKLHSIKNSELTIEKGDNWLVFNCVNICRSLGVWTTKYDDVLASRSLFNQHVEYVILFFIHCTRLFLPVQSEQIDFAFIL